MELAYWLIIFLAPYEFASLCLYFRILYILIRKKRFYKQPFFQMIIINGFFDICHFLLDYIFYRLSYWPFFIAFYSSFEKARWISLICASINITAYMQSFFHLALSLNRLSGICFPFRHKKIWENLSIYLTGIFLAIACILSSDRILSFGKFIPTIINGTTLVVYPSPVDYQFYQFDQSLLMIIVVTFCCTIALVVNFTALFILRKNKYKSHSNETVDKIELNLLIVTIFMMIPQILFTLFFIFLRIIVTNQSIGQWFMSSDNINKTSLLYMTMTQIIWVDDIYCLTQPCSSFRHNTCILLALEAFFRILHQLGHFHFLIIASSGINFYPIRLALPFQSYSAIGVIAGLNQVVFLSFDRLFSVLAPLYYRQLNQRIYISCLLLANLIIITYKFAQLIQAANILPEWPCTGSTSDLFTMPSVGPYYWTFNLIISCAPILAYLLMLIIIKLKTEIATEKQQKIYHSLQLIVLINVIAYISSLLLPMLYKFSLLQLTQLQFWFLNLFTSTFFLNIGAMSNAPILYYNSMDYRNVFKKEFKKSITLFKAICRRQEQSAINITPISNHIIK